MINLEEFQKRKEYPLQEQIFDLLSSNQVAFTPKDIAEILKINSNIVASTMLERLKDFNLGENKLLIHKRPYWMFNWDCVPFPQDYPLKINIKELNQKWIKI